MRKSRGFEGELFIQIPKMVLSNCQKLPLIKSVFITHMGFYPKALHHYYQRVKGASEVILIYCTDGSGWLEIENETFAVRAGEICIIPADTPHVYGADAENPWSIYWFHLSGKNCPDVREAILRNEIGPSYVVHVGYSEERNTLFKQIATTLLKGYSTSNLLFANLSLSYYLATIISPEHFRHKATLTRQPDVIGKAIQFMQDHLSKAITLDNIAESVNLSVSFFSRKFKQETGYAPIAYFNHLRIQKACQLLHFGELRVNEVAFEVGIDDPFYFSRLFKQQMGVSPAKYRGKG